MKKLWNWHVEHLDNPAYFYISAIVVGAIGAFALLGIVYWVA